ncbi:MAG: hypothetical protein HY897_19025 [Deltaproteobacteria bacterium]|nr:hypothetical protein [Deltaproteobacteria bacterium]
MAREETRRLRRSLPFQVRQILAEEFGRVEVLEQHRQVEAARAVRACDDSGVEVDPGAFHCFLLCLNGN